MFVNRCIYASAYARCYHNHITLMMFPHPPPLNDLQSGFLLGKYKTFILFDFCISKF